jgi:hypothetical protein
VCVYVDVRVRARVFERERKMIFFFVSKKKIIIPAKMINFDCSLNNIFRTVDKVTKNIYAVIFSFPVVQEIKQVLATVRNCTVHLIYHCFRKGIYFGRKCEIYSYFNTVVQWGVLDRTQLVPEPRSYSICSF